MEMMRVLRKLKLLDYLIVLVLLLFGVLLFKFFNPQEKWVTIAVAANDIPFYQVNSLQAGDIEKSSSGEEIAEIVSVQTYDTSKTLAASKDVFLWIKLFAKVNPRNGELEYKNKIIKIGSPIEFRFNTGFITGKVAEFEGSRSVTKKGQREIIIILYDQWPWLAESIKVGEGEKSEKGEQMLEILSKEAKPAEITVTTAGGETLKRIDPRKVDITLKVKVLVQAFENQLIFRQDEIIAVGEFISFNAGKTRVKDALIESIE